MQPKANYRLIMRDEFNGDALDTNLWSWAYNHQRPTLRDGKLSFLFFPELRVKSSYNSRPASSAEIANAGIAKRCAYSSKVINSTVNFQYGYIEFDITGNLPIPGTFSTIISYPTGPGIAATPEYALTTPLDENLDALGKPTLQDVLSLVGAEIDIMEQYSSWNFNGSWNDISVRPYFVTHYGPHWSLRYWPDNIPTWNSESANPAPSAIYNAGRAYQYWPGLTYGGRAPVRATKIGLEWTPAGFRKFVDGKQITYANNNCSDKNDSKRRCTYGRQYGHDGFNYRSTVMAENDVIPAGVPHLPQSFNIEANGGGYWHELHPTKPGCNGTVETCCVTDGRYEMDSVRVWQPTDKYANVTPVYQ